RSQGRSVDRIEKTFWEPICRPRALAALRLLRVYARIGWEAVLPLACKTYCGIGKERAVSTRQDRHRHAFVRSAEGNRKHQDVRGPRPGHDVAMRRGGKECARADLQARRRGGVLQLDPGCN